MLLLLKHILMCPLMSKKESPFYEVKSGNSERLLLNSKGFYGSLLTAI